MRLFSRFHSSNVKATAAKILPENYKSRIVDIQKQNISRNALYTRIVPLSVSKVFTLLFYEPN